LFAFLILKCRSTISSTIQTQPDTNDPLRIPTRQPPLVGPSIFGDPYGGIEPSTINPFNVGRDDLDPLGSNPLIGPPRFGGDIGRGIPSRGGGMLVGPDHPMFGQRGPSRGDEIFGGPQNLPRGAVPPGARFDPIGPFGPQPLPRPGQPRGRGRNFPSGGPDNDELPPPGYNDMFM